MKFHCDRCKTKYSISDDRVRGKILKIRCKNCSAVITVREPSNGSGAQPVITEGDDRRSSTGGGAEARAGASASARVGQEALAGAFKQAVTEPKASVTGSGAAPAPVSLDAEWYLSKDGQQEGPFSLEEARAWVGKKKPNDELYVWSEGYDDWLAIDKVSHFRGVRRAMQQTNDDGDEATMIDSSGGLGFLEETPKPLFAATMEAVSEGRPDSIDEEFPHKMAAKATASSPFAEMAKVARPGSAAPPIPAAARLGGSGSSRSTGSLGTGSLGTGSLGAGSLGAGSLGAVKPAAHAAPAPALAAAPATSALPAQAAAPAPAPLPKSPFVAMNGAAAGKDASSSLEFDIGEASRVVDLPTLLAHRGNARSVTPGGNAMPGVADSLGRGTGIAPALSNTAPLGTIGADAAPIVIPEQNTSKRRGVAIPLLVVGVFVIASAAGLLIHFMGDSASERSVARGSVGGSGNLGYSFSDTGKRIPNKGAKVEEPTTEDGASGTKGTGTKIKRQVSGTKVETNTLPADRNQGRDTGEVDLSGSSSKSGPTGPLDGDDLMQVYRKNNIAIKMCYERSLKKNPLLKVPKTWVDIQVGLDGRVTSVNIPSLAGSELGTCILGRISRWKFRETTELFSSRFPLVFDR